MSQRWTRALTQIRHEKHMQTEQDNKLGPSTDHQSIEHMNVDTQSDPDAKGTEHVTECSNGQNTPKVAGATVMDPADDVLPQVEKPQEPMPKPTALRKQDSAIDPETLVKFEDSMQKMREKKKKKAVMITVRIKSMDAMFPIFEVEIDHNLTVSDLKEEIREHSPDKIDPLRQRLIHGGRLMSREGRTLTQCNVRNNDIVMLVRSRRNQTISSRNEGGAQRKNSGKRGRNRAMTLGAPQAMIRRSTTPDPSQTTEVY